MRSRLRVFRLISVIFVVLLVVTSSWWLAALGGALVNAADPRRADVAVVLAGDWSGSRILKACELARAGFVPQILVSGPMAWYGINEAEGAIRFAVENGCERSALVPVYIEAWSTRDEARELKPELVRRGVKQMLLVTSDYHTARAFRVFRREFQEDIEITPVAAADRFFTPDNWWRHREGLKTFFYEATKTAADWIRL